MLLKHKFIIVFLFFASATQAQLKLESSVVKTDFHKQHELRNIMLDNAQVKSTNPASLALPYSPAFFCLIEDKIEAKSKIPLRFRLGSLQAVDIKEGKGCGFRSEADRNNY